MYFESHAHYDDRRFNVDRDELLSSTLPNAGVSHIVNVGADMRSSRFSVKLSKAYDYIYASVGVHPHEVKNMTENDIKELEQMAKNKKVVAIGEIGLDYYYNHSPKDAQIYWFKKQLELAAAVKLPVIIHSRDAGEETFNILEEWGNNITSLLTNNEYKKGVIHCFSEDARMAMEYVKMGFFIGIGGSVTFPKAQKTAEVAATVPLDKILIETDCPYLSPVPKRGQRNDSQNLEFISDKIAQIRQISRQEVENVTKNTSLNLFSLK